MALARGHLARYIARGQGSKLIDIDGHEYTDLSLSHGAGVLGHDHPAIRAAVLEALSVGTVCSMDTRYHSPASRPRGGRPRRRRGRGSSCGHRADPPFNPSPAALRRRNGRAPPPMSAIATSQALCATLQGQQEQRGAGAPPSQRRQRVPRSSRNPHFQTSLRLEVALPSACAGS